MLIGLTGGMGSGKSTAARIFEENGFARLDSDAVIRAEILRRPDVVNAVASRFGGAVLTSEGRIDRAALARVVFADEAELRWLEELVHPRLYAHWREILAGNSRADRVFEVPLLFEKALENWFDFTVCVATTSARQFARLAERGIPHALAEQRISKQLPLVQKLELADFVLSNDGSLAFLRDQVSRLIATIGVRR